MTDRTGALAEIHMQIMWNRLISVVEEQAQTLIRTAFSTTVREAGDLSAGVFDGDGRMLAQAVTGTPGHVNSMANAVKHFVAAHPVETMNPGDHFISNDPWLTSGHLHDLTVVSPAFRGGTVVGLLACTCHVVDIGGRGFGPDGRQVYEEGLFIPIMHLARAGRMNDDLLALVRANVREPMQVEGDIFSFAASNDAGIRRLEAMMAEFGLDDLGDLGSHIIERSRAATVAEIAKWPNGVYDNTMRTDGYDQPVDLVARMTVGDETMAIDYTGSSTASPYGINVVLNYCQAYTVFGLKCIVAPAIPNNAGSLAPFEVTAPEGSILNVRRPWPVAARHVIGHMLPDAVFGCLHQAMEGRVLAEGASAAWQSQLRGGASAVDADAVGGNVDAGPDFDVVTFNAGGHRRAADQGRSFGHRLPQWRARHACRGHRADFAGGDLAQGTAARLRRRREMARRSRSEHGIRQPRRRPLRHPRHVRPGRQSGQGPGRRRPGGGRRGRSQVGPGAALERPADHSGGRPPAPGTAGRRRSRRPPGPRPRPHRRGCPRRPGQPRGGARLLRCCPRRRRFG